IARSHATRQQSANDHNADSLWTRSDFDRRAPGMDWPAFFLAAGLEKQESFVAWQPSAITGVAALVNAEPLESWKDYLRFHAVAQYAEVLPRAVAQSTRPQTLRSQRAIEATQQAMSDALGKMYAERYFPAEQKARVRRIVDNVTAAFIKRVEGASWMAPA